MLGTEILETYPGNIVFYILLSIITSNIYRLEKRKKDKQIILAKDNL